MSDKQTCNQENGCMSELWGRDCWIADSMLKLVEAAFDAGEYPRQDDSASDVCEKVVAYCKELRKKNREPHFDDVIWTSERPV